MEDTNTSTATHTPGPWLVEGTTVYALQESDEWEGKGADRRRALMNRFSLGVQGPCPKPEQEANARLIAAAPDMLAALEEARQFMILARTRFPKTVQNDDRFRLENVSATIGTAIHKARNG